MKNRILLCLILMTFMILSLAACGRRTASETETEAQTASETETIQATESETQEEDIMDLQRVIEAIERSSVQPSFGISTRVKLDLNGNLIKGTYHFKSDVHVKQGENHEDMQMSSKASSDMDDVVTTSCYKDGWYYLNDKNGKQKEEKSADEVLELISTVTNLVTDAAEKIEKAEVVKDGTDIVYTYELPAYLAQKYLKQLVDSTDEEQITGASIKIKKAVLVSTVDENGFLKTQKVKISGSIHKFIITVPAKAEITAKFRIPDTQDPTIKTW